MSGGVFVTGTDTGVGKSLCSAALLVAIRRSGARAFGMKPVASGCRETAAGLRNDDAELLLAHGSAPRDYALVNPYAFAEAIAPSIAAELAGVNIDPARLQSAYTALSGDAGYVVVEGVGGWAAPLSNSLMQADLVRLLQLPVILVIGLRLGCINHALLSARIIAADGGRLLGWIGSTLDADMPRLGENLATLRTLLPVPCLGLLPYQAAPDPLRLADHLADAVAALRV